MAVTAAVRWTAPTSPPPNNSPANIEVQDLEMTVNSATQPGTTNKCGSAGINMPFAYTVCLQFTTAMTNWQNINAANGPITDAYGFPYDFNPGNWNSAADLAHCDPMSCPVTRKGPLTCTDSTHCFYSTDEHLVANPTGIPTYIAGGLFDIAPYKKITITGFELFNSPLNCAVSNTDGPFTLTRDVQWRNLYLHDCSNYGLRTYKTSKVLVEDVQCDGDTVPTQCFQGQSDENTTVVNMRARSKWTAPGAAPAPVNQIRDGFSTGFKLINPTLWGASSRYIANGFAPYVWCDTCLSPVFQGGTANDGSTGLLLEVSKGATVTGMTMTQPAFGVETRYRLDAWTLYNFNNITLSEPHTIYASGPKNITAHPPVAFNGAAISQGTAAFPSNGDGTTGEMKVDLTGFNFNNGNLIFCIDMPQNGSNVVHTDTAGAGNLTVTLGTVTLVFDNVANPFMLAPALTMQTDTNSVTITNATNTVINGTHTLTALGTHSISFVNSGLGIGPFTENTAVVTGNRIFRLDPWPVRQMFVGSLVTDGGVQIDSQRLALVASTDLGCVNPNQAWPIPAVRVATAGNVAASWGAIKTFYDPKFGEKTNGAQSFGLVALAANTTYKFDVTDLKFDIFQNEDNEINGVVIQKPYAYGVWVIGAHHLGLHNIKVYDAGWGGDYNSGGSVVVGKRNAGSAILLDTNVNSQASGSTPIDSVDISGIHAYQSFSNVFSAVDVAAVKADCGASGATISNISIDPRSIFLNDYNTGNAIQLGNCGNGSVGNVVMPAVTWTQNDDTADQSTADAVAVNVLCGGVQCPACDYELKSCIDITVGMIGDTSTISMTVGYTTDAGAQLKKFLTTPVTIPANKGETCATLNFRSNGTAQLTKQVTFSAAIGASTRYRQHNWLVQETLQ
jgi:hypothetical protein